MGGAGDERMAGGAGADVSLLNASSGAGDVDIVFGFEDGIDLFRIQGATVDGIVDTAVDAVIGLSSGGRIPVRDVLASSLTTDDIL